MSDKWFEPTFLSLFAAMMFGLGWLVGCAFGFTRRRPKLTHCLDCGDKWDGLCADCRWKLNGDIEQDYEAGRESAR